MTEVDTSMPEGNALSTAAALQVSSAGSAASSSNTLTETQLKEQQNGQHDSKVKCAGANASVSAMEVDGVDSEEDDSQITSSTENGGGAVGGGGEDSKMSEDGHKRDSPITSNENSKAESTKSPAPCESSTNACDADSQQCDSSAVKSAVDEESRGSENSSGKQDTGDSTLSEKKNAEDRQVSNSVADTPAECKESASKADAKDGKDAKDAKEGKRSESTKNPLAVKESPQRENGVASSGEAANVAGIVDLGDDTDEEMEAVPKQKQLAKADIANGSGSGVAGVGVGAVKADQSKSVCSDSDGAVVIGSDSESEAPPANKGNQKATLPPAVEDDDDDDDCVVIEDDSPAPDSASDLNKRKLNALEAANSSDDSQPPNKRQRSGAITPGNNNNSINQLTIKDARSLMATPEAANKRLPENAVYPVNITPAAGVMPGPPKLLPMSNAASLPLPGLTGLSANNANLLPGLTDDMFVLEAPSFIVPYIYEKPPADNLKEIIKEIESKYKLTKEDLAEADNQDEFDMITEQNKEDKDKEEKDEKNSKKNSKKKRRGGDDPDESWSEESDEDEEDDDDDDDSVSGMRTKVLIKEASDDLTVLKGAIKPAAAVVQSQAAANAALVKPGQENYFESPLGKFFMDIGVGLVQEFVQSDLIRLQKRKMRKSLGKNITEFERAIAALSGNLDASKKKNSAFKFTMKRCEFCNFKSESALAMANHYETPHMNGPLYKCNFCNFEIRNATEIVYHMEAVHNIKARLIKPLPYHQCPNCGFEDNGKAKLARHQPVCAKKFRPELNLAPPNDWEAPAKIPRIKPRHGLVGTATAYQAMAAQAAAQKAALASIQQQQQVAQARSLQAAALAAQNAVKIRGRPPLMTPKAPGPSPVLRGPNQVRNPMATNVVLPNNYQLAGGQLIQTANALAKKSLTGQPSISITPLPRQSASQQASTPSTSKMPPAGMKPGQSPTGGNKTQFVICEICDGYIKDLEQLRNHMQWMHKVKIHPKMIYNRPPLNCQKCQFRFFTDQGLERHLLGSHGLVTSSMQEAANKGKDAGRCPVCGRMYQWKLLNHVSRDHHMTLKPAHLSYKCTVCTATFGMYKQFETHVYTAHSTVAKKAMDGKKSNASPSVAGSASGSSSTQRNSLGVSNDSLLKPLKINDEITIIPQPASKPRITNMESHVID